MCMTRSLNCRLLIYFLCKLNNVGPMTKLTDSATITPLPDNS